MYPEKILTPPPIELHTLILEDFEDEGQLHAASLAIVVPYILIGALILISYWGISILGPGVLNLFDQLGALALAANSENTDQILTSGIPDEKISPLFTDEIQHWDDDIIRWSDNYDLDPNIVAVVMQIESCGHPSVESSAGANGLFQVMPFHFEQGENPIHPETNAKRGLNYLQASFELSGGDPTLALAGYNGGHSVIYLPQDDWADETRRYVHWGTGILADIYSGNLTSPTLNLWLQAGGSTLCDRAADVLGTGS